MLYWTYSLYCTVSYLQYSDLCRIDYLAVFTLKFAQGKLKNNCRIKGIVSQDSLLQVFLQESHSPKHPKITLGSFRIFRKFAEIFASQGAPLVSTTPATNFPPVSMTHRWQICHLHQRHRWQIMGKILGCKHLKVNLKAKVYIYVNSTTQRCPNKIIKIFLLEDFFHLPLVSTTLVVHLEPQISPRIFEKIWNGRIGLILSY